MLRKLLGIAKARNIGDPFTEHDLRKLCDLTGCYFDMATAQNLEIETDINGRRVYARTEGGRWASKPF